MSESNFMDLAEDDLAEVSGGCHRCCGGCWGRRDTTVITATIPAGYSLSTIPGAPVTYGVQVQTAVYGKGFGSSGRGLAGTRHA